MSGNFWGIFELDRKTAMYYEWAGILSKWDLALADIINAKII